MLIFVFDLALKPKTVFQRTDYQHCIENEKDLIEGRGYALRQWKERGDCCIFLSPPLSYTAKQVFICFLLLSNYSIAIIPYPIIPFHYPLGTIF